MAARITAPSVKIERAQRTRECRAVYFAEFTIENCRCFGPAQSLRLTDESGRPAQWTVLLGNNGTGKTTILQALAAFDIVELEFTQQHADGTSEAEVLLGARALHWHGYGYRRNFSRYGEDRSAEFSATIAISDLTGMRAATPKLTKKHIVPRHVFPGCDGEFPRCFGYGAARRSGGGTISRKAQRDGTASLFSDRVPLRNAEELLLQLDYGSSRKSDSQQRLLARLDLVKELLLRVIPDVTGIRFATPKGEEVIPSVEFQTPYGWVHLDGLGYGYTSLVVWLTDLVSRLIEEYPDSEDPLSEPAVVLVDEIDLHLHPTWQRQLMSYLSERFPNTQFIVTAHSPLIVQAAPSVNANIAVLRREGDHVVIDNTKASVDGWRLDQILTSELFGLPSARAAEYDEALNRRVELLSQPKLSAAQKKELTRLDNQLKHLPAGETATQAQEMIDLAKSTMELLGKHKGRRK